MEHKGLVVIGANQPKERTKRALASELGKNTKSRVTKIAKTARQKKKKKNSKKKKRRETSRVREVSGWVGAKNQN